MRLFCLTEDEVPDSVLHRAESEYDRIRAGRRLSRYEFLDATEKAANSAAYGTGFSPPGVTRALRASLRSRKAPSVSGPEGGATRSVVSAPPSGLGQAPSTGQREFSFED